MAKKDIMAMSEDELAELDLTALSAAELVQYGERAKWTRVDLEQALKLRNDYQNLDRKNGQRETFVGEVKRLWEAIGGAQSAVTMSEEQLIDSALQFGAHHRHLGVLLELQSSFKDIEHSVERQRRDPEYAAEVAKGAAEFDQLFEEVTKEDKGMAFKIGQRIGKLLS